MTRCGSHGYRLLPRDALRSVPSGWTPSTCCDRFGCAVLLVQRPDGLHRVRAAVPDPAGRLAAVRGRAVHRHRAGPRHSASACVVLSAAAFLGNVVGYEIGRAADAPLYERDGRFLKQQLLRPDQRLLRAARQQGPRHRPASCRSCARSSPWWPASAGWTAGGSSPGAWSAPCCGRPGSPCSGTSSARRSPCCRTSWSWRCWPSWPCRWSRPWWSTCATAAASTPMADEAVDAVEDVRSATAGRLPAGAHARAPARRRPCRCGPLDAAQRPAPARRRRAGRARRRARTSPGDRPAHRTHRRGPARAPSRCGRRR